jgi:hypothetical protein
MVTHTEAADRITSLLFLMPLCRFKWMINPKPN